MIRLWISRRASLPIREQLSAQLLLGILSRRLAPGERLPSVRDLARRLEIHGNTVLAVYRDLAKRGWVRAQAGSGVFVREHRWPAAGGGLDDLVRTWIEEAQTLGFSAGDVQAAIARQRQPGLPRRLAVVDSDEELARILAAELSAVLGLAVAWWSCEEAARAPAEGTTVLAHAGQAEHVAKAIGTAPMQVIHLKSMQDVLAGQKRPAFAALIAVVSRSKSILAWASTLLCSLGFSADDMLLRDATEKGWDDGLAVCDIIAADVVAAAAFPERLRRPVVVRLVSEDSLAEVQRLVTAQEVS
jgi:DNA-binding transcriptional regulator YhcF (GntR family)